MNRRLARLGLKTLTVLLTLLLVLFYRIASPDGIDSLEVLVMLVIGGGAAVYAYLKTDAIPRGNYTDERDK